MADHTNPADVLSRLRSVSEDEWRSAVGIQEGNSVMLAIDEIVRLRAENDALTREVERWRHDAPVEGDFVCPLDLEVYALRAVVEAARVADASCGDRWEEMDALRDALATLGKDTTNA